MSVYTKVSEPELALFLRDYDLGDARALIVISACVENINYFLDTEKGHFILTKFERLPRNKISYSLAVTEWLSLRAIPCPSPVHTTAGNSLSKLCGKPACLAPCWRA